MAHQIVYAHTRADLEQASWETLGQHLTEVQTTTAALAGVFGAEAWGSLLGQCHDLGKASAAFQSYIRSRTAGETENAGEEVTPGRVDHSTFGARYVMRTMGGVHGQLLAFCIAGHHGGLPDMMPIDDATGRSTLQWRLDENHPIPAVPDPSLQLARPAMPAFTDDQTLPFALAFFTRMIFSTLIDADRTCTEAFVDPTQAEERRTLRPSMGDLHARLHVHLKAMQRNALPSAVNRQRGHVLDQCRTAAALSPGFFSLQVPTGGGKTLSSLAFSLAHAIRHDKRRVVFAIPFTSIIEQTADVYRRALGPLADRGLVEHHTNIEAVRQTRANQLGAENWDAPLVVTTNVQLFESLFAAKTTPCQKVHNLANSVIVLDEAQTLPVELLEPTLAALRELVAHFGCTVVLCTATQPALQHRKDFSIGLRDVRPIIADPEPLFTALKRVEVKHAGRLSDDGLIKRVASEPGVLCIVNTRPHAARLYAALVAATDTHTCFHLSTLMYGAHRRRVLKTIRQRLKAKLPCRVVSTQLIEAGVDVDFPIVYRAAAGLDSMAQAAGRCNREGLLPAMGITWIFDTEEALPQGFLEQSRQAGNEILSQPHYASNPLAPATIEAYFRRLYWSKKGDWDKHRVMPCFVLDRAVKGGSLLFQFRQAAEAYQIIEDTQLPILIPREDAAKEFLRLLRDGIVEYVSQRSLQPYLVSVPRRAFDQMTASGVIQSHPSGIGLLLRDDVYSEQTGLKLEDFGLDARAWGV